jgi:F-type H+-transporting ATPase subunit delta
MFSVVLRKFSSFGDRYAITLFRAAQGANQLKEVSGDMKYILELYTASPDFKVLLTDPTIGRAKTIDILNDLGTKALFCETTSRVMKLMANNKRLNYLAEVAKTYEIHVKSLEKKETVRVVSADQLGDDEKKEVQKALQEMDKNKKYELTFSVDPSILGGLQLYFPSAFMELSLRSRFDKIKEEVSNIGV